MAFPVRTLVLLLLAGPAFCAPAEAPQVGETAMRVFADELFESGEYFRAATEYLRLLSYGQPAGDDRDFLRFQVARCSFKASRFQEAGRLFARLAAETESPKLRDDCRLLLAASRMRALDYAGSLEIAQEAGCETSSPPYESRFAYMKGLNLLHLERPEEAADAFSAVPETDPLGQSARRLEAIARRARDLPRYKPLATGTLSALVPGLGQMACGYFWDGLAAMALTGASLAIGFAGERRDNPTLAAAGFTLFGVWHAGNIYGGANAARRANRQARERLLAAARAQNALSLE